MPTAKPSRFRLSPDVRPILYDLHLVPDPQGRARPVVDAAGQERERELVRQVVVPSHGLLLRAVRIDDNLLFNALVPTFILLGFGHVLDASTAAEQDKVNLRGQREGRESLRA
jgi:hypothetical protein